MRAVILGLTLSMLGAATGCGGSEDGGVSGEINVLAVLSYTGADRASADKHQAAIQMAFDDLERVGELVPGRRLRLWPVDAAGDAAEGDARVREALGMMTGPVAGIISSGESAQFASIPAAVEMEIPHIEGSSGVPWHEAIDPHDPRAQQFLFSAAAGDAAEALLAADYMGEMRDWETAYVMRGGTRELGASMSINHDRTQTRLLRARLRANGWGGRILNDSDHVMEYGEGYAEHFAALMAMPEQPHVVVFVVTGERYNTEFLTAASNAGYTGHLLTVGPLSEQILDPYNPGIVDYVADRVWHVERKPLTADIGNRYMPEFQNDFESFFGDAADPWSASVYDAAFLLGLSFVTAGTEPVAAAQAIVDVSSGGAVAPYSETAATFAAARQGTDVNYEGASGTVDIRAVPIQGADRDTMFAVPGQFDVRRVTMVEEEGAFVNEATYDDLEGELVRRR